MVILYNVVFECKDQSDGILEISILGVLGSDWARTVIPD